MYTILGYSKTEDIAVSRSQSRISLRHLFQILRLFNGVQKIVHQNLDF